MGGPASAAPRAVSPQGGSCCPQGVPLTFRPACGLGLREVGTPSGEKPGQETGHPVGASVCRADPFVFPHLCALIPRLHVLDEAPGGRPRRPPGGGPCETRRLCKCLGQSHTFKVCLPAPFLAAVFRSQAAGVAADGNGPPPIQVRPAGRNWKAYARIRALTGANPAK